MNIWYLMWGSLDDVSTLVHGSKDEIYDHMFDAVGKPIHWTHRPPVKVFIEPRKKKAKPRVDVSVLQPGSLVLNERAKAVLGAFLLQFGQFLELDCEGTVEYFYNVTKVIDCIDYERCDRRVDGWIAKEAFFEDRLPTAPTVFKDPRTIGSRIYANDPAKAILEALINEAGITGAALVELGPPPRRHRPQI